MIGERIYGVVHKLDPKGKLWIAPDIDGGRGSPYVFCVIIVQGFTLPGMKIRIKPREIQKHGATLGTLRVATLAITGDNT